MKLLNKIVLMAILLVIIPGFMAGKDKALANADDGQDIQFSLEFPENQDKNTKGYFNLTMRPGQTQTVHIHLTNYSNESKTIKIIKTNALTTQNGGIHYTEEESSDLSYSLSQNFLASNYITVDSVIELPAHSTRKLPVVLQAPQEKGTFLGGILFTAVNPANQGNNEKIQINSEVRVGMAIQMNVGERAIPEIEVKESVVEIYPSGIQIQTRIENPSPSIVKSYKLHYKVYNDKNELLFQGGTDEFDMAPFTGIMFPANWNAGQFNEGRYQIELTIEGEGNTFTKRNGFEVKKADTKEYVNTNTVTEGKPIVKKDNTTLIYLLTGIIVLLIVIILIMAFKKRR